MHGGRAAGENTIGDTDFYDAELQRHNEHFRAAAGVRPGDHVLDIGCGTGQSTRQAARVAINGTVLGVDISAPMLERARQLSDDEGLHNVTYQQGDAQTQPFPSAYFDLCISRFGTMFFADPLGAFTNIGRALRPAGRLVLLVWQDSNSNEWFTAVREALTAGTATPPPPSSGADPFSLGDPAVTRGILTAAGFIDVGFTDVHEPVYYGPDGAVAYDNVLGLRHAKDLLDTMDATMAERALQRLRTTLAAHETDSGVFFDSRAWIVTARRH